MGITSVQLTGLTFCQPDLGIVLLPVPPMLSYSHTHILANIRHSVTSAASRVAPTQDCPVHMDVSNSYAAARFQSDSKRTAPRPARPSQRNLLALAYLVEVFACGSHLLPGFVQQLDADAEEFLEGAIVREEHGMEVVAVFTGCGKRKERRVIIMCKKAPANATARRPLGIDSDFRPPGVHVGRRWLKDRPPPSLRSVHLLFVFLPPERLTPFNSLQFSYN